MSKEVDSLAYMFLLVAKSLEAYARQVQFDDLSYLTTNHHSVDDSK